METKLKIVALQRIGEKTTFFKDNFHAPIGTTKEQNVFTKVLN